LTRRALPTIVPATRPLEELPMIAITATLYLAESMWFFAAYLRRD
jgi:hypothetical protein